MLYADRVEHIGERDARRIEIGFIIANADLMPRGAVHDQNLDLSGRGAKRIQPACRCHGAPEASEPGAKRKNAFAPGPNPS